MQTFIKIEGKTKFRNKGLYYLIGLFGKDPEVILKTKKSNVAKDRLERQAEQKRLKESINNSGYLQTEASTYGAPASSIGGRTSPGKKSPKKARFADDNDVIISTKKGGVPSKRRIAGKKILSPSSLKNKERFAYSEALS